MNKRSVIAEIKLAPGEVGYYDDYSRIHLTAGNPTALIYAGVNCTQIKRSIKSGRLILLRGGFDTPQEIPANPKVVAPKTEVIVKKEEVKKVVKEEKKTETEPVKVEEVVKPIETKVEEPVSVKEEIVKTEEIKVEDPAPKKRTNKRKYEKPAETEEIKTEAE